MLTLSVILLINFIFVLVTGEPTAVVNTTSGPVQGQILSTVVNSVQYASFTGIRFGKAPIGHLRFKPPLPVDPWTETLNATTPGPECPQFDSITNLFNGSEDCLFLNIYTTVTDLTKTPTKLKSVMVWIFGGSFIHGSESDPRYQPDYLLERDVVLVTINYRLGALGFLSLNHPNATGNAGLKDQVLALKWIQANVQKFGGNPKNVTLFGQSSGAVCIGFHVLSESSAGLFHGAISQSGTPLIPWGFLSLTDSEARARKLASNIGENSRDKNKILKALYAASAEDLVTNTRNINPAIPFAPTIEDPSIATDVFISRCSLNKYNTGNFTKVPQLLGFMQQETVGFILFLNIFTIFIDQAVRMLPSTVLSVVKILLGSTSLKDTLLELAINESSNLFLKAPIDTTQRLLAAQNDGKPVYYYHITFATNTSLHNIDNDIDTIGAGHADELAYIFYVPYANYSHDLSDPTGRTIYRVSTMWTNFAKYGNPTPDWVDEYPLGVTWPTSGCDGKSLNIGNDLTVGSRPIGLSAEILEAVNHLTLGEQNGCTTRTSAPTCQKNVNSLFSIDVPIF